MGGPGPVARSLVLGLDGGASGQRRTWQLQPAGPGGCGLGLSAPVGLARSSSLHVRGPSSPAHELIPPSALASHQTWPLCPVLCEAISGSL